MRTIKTVLVLLVLTLNFVQTQQQANQITTNNNNDIMKTFVIERIIPLAEE